MSQGERSPKIVDLSWGRMEVDGLGIEKDWKLYPGGGRPWDWSETGTEHVPGVQVADVEELVAYGATVVVLSLGMDRRLHVDQATLRYMEERSVEVHMLETREAVKVYNDLAEDNALAGLFHSTC